MAMSIYRIPICTQPAQGGPIGETACLTHSWFGGAESPHTVFRMDFCPGVGFRAVMQSAETPDPCRFHAEDEPVYQDSCMELFMDFFPALSNGYVNIEVNAAGAMLCMFGPSRAQRRFTREITPLRPTAETEILPSGGWRLHLEIPLRFIEALYGTADFRPGHTMRGNLYKCGDKTSRPHWGSWNSLGEHPIDFHQPETFGELVLDEAGSPLE